MPRTPDRRPGEQIEDDRILFEDRGSHPNEVGSLYRVGDALFGYDSSGLFDLRSGSGLSEAQHEALDTLVHDLAEDAYVEVTRSGDKVTDVVAWTDSGKTIKVRETTITRSSGKVSQVVVMQYDGSGTLSQTLTGTVARSAGKVASIDWVLT